MIYKDHTNTGLIKKNHLNIILSSALPACIYLLVPLFGFRLRLLFVLATEHTMLRMFLNIWRHILFLGDLHDAPFRISVQLILEPLIIHAICNSQHP